MIFTHFYLTQVQASRENFGVEPTNFSFNKLTKKSIRCQNELLNTFIFIDVAIKIAVLLTWCTTPVSLC